MGFLYDTFSYLPESPLIFSNPYFWLFFLPVLAFYQVFYENIRRRTIFLLLISLFFYYKTGGLYFFLLIFSTIVDFYLALGIYSSRKPWLKKALLLLSILINLGLLAYFKYASFMIEQLNWILDTRWQALDYFSLWSNLWVGTSFDISEILLPVGISFYTFQTLSYSIDVYRGKIKPLTGFFDFAFYVSFFPQLVAGPIVRAADFIPQIRLPYQVSTAEYGTAVFLILNGLIKKILISDYLSLNFVDRVFETPHLYTGFENLMAIYGYAIQIYCDFSGYTDIAIGLALLLGFRLSLNFRSPYKAVDLSDFWRRWHISLSLWLRDYLYIPLGGNRGGKWLTYRNLMITMLLGGLWHGAHWKFMWWGGLHGAGLIGQDLLRKHVFLPFWLRWMLTFHFVCLCWIFFRARDVSGAWQILSRITFSFGWEGIGSACMAHLPVLGLMLGTFLIHFLPEGFKKELREFFTVLPELVKALIITAVIIGLYQVKSGDIQPFIYFRF